MPDALTAFLDALTALGVVTGVARSSVVYALVSASHVLGIALLVGPIALVDLRLLGVGLRLDALALRALRGAARAGLALAALTGLLLSTARPAEYAGNWAFQAKLAILALAVLNALAFERRTRGAGALDRRDGADKTMAAASLALWLAVLLLGRWIAFV